MKAYLLLGLLFTAICPALAQTDSLLRFTVEGRVADAHSGKSIPAVNIQVPGRNFATVSNADGGFLIRSDAPIRELVFSCLGYKTKRQEVTEDPLQVRLVPEKYLLDASTIVSGDPQEIVRSAILSIPDNYPRQAELMRCFYRETLQKRGRYISVSEAVARIWKSSYLTSVWADKAALEKSRIILSQRRRDTLSVKLQGGPTMALTADAVKNPELLLADFEAGFYGFRMEAPEYIGDRLQFVIRFFPVTTLSYALYEGLLYIDRETLAFTRMEYAMDMSEPDKVTRQLLVRKPFGLRFRPRELSFVISFRPSVGGRSRLEYFRSQIRFDCDWRKRMISTSYTLVNETVVTDVLEPAKTIARQEQFRPTDVLSEKAYEFLDPAFWEGYNIIAPSESLEHAVDRLKKGR